MRIRVPQGSPASAAAKFIITAITAALLAGCSDSIERFSSNYNNPSDTDPVYTASVPKFKKPMAQKYAAPGLASNEEAIVQSPIAATPLYKKPSQAFDYTQNYKKSYKQPKLAYEVTPQASAVKQPALAYNNSQSYKKPIYAAPIAEEQAANETLAPATPIYKVKAKTAHGGTTVRVGNGMTMYSIAKANGLTVQQLAAANGIAAPYTVSTGRMLRIPGGKTAQTPVVAATKSAPILPSAEDQATAQPKFKTRANSDHVVATGDTLFSLGRKYGVSPFAIADLNRLAHNKSLSVGEQLRIPSGGTTQVMAEKATHPTTQNQEIIADNNTNGPSQNETATAPLALPKANSTTAAVTQTPITDPASTLAMRWPVKGKVISEFGTKPNGLKNEGINIAVPEGTSIRAAESGVVAYAGNELKGYGNLVLVRHPGGYVTAYAHAKQLMVKKGDTVKRGDVIAIAGQTGAVQSPQLHFEVRKGATALDPNKYLSSSTAMN
jgi:murein DD-endopeptidase MepM/ murein hydrolase activator NlpD